METWSQGMSRCIGLASLCLTLILPAEIHATSLDVGGHDIEGAVSVQARHADQKGHFEHSTVELRSHCVACVLTQKSDSLPFLPEVRQGRMSQIGALETHDAPTLEQRLDRHAPSRAPPLL